MERRELASIPARGIRVHRFSFAVTGQTKGESHNMGICAVGWKHLPRSVDFFLIYHRIVNVDKTIVKWIYVNGSQ